MESGASDNLADSGNHIYSPVDGESDHGDATRRHGRCLDKCSKRLDSICGHSTEYYSNSAYASRRLCDNLAREPNTTRTYAGLVESGASDSLADSGNHIYSAMDCAADHGDA